MTFRNVVGNSAPYIDRMTKLFEGLEVCAGLPGLRRNGLMDETESKLVLIDDQMTELMSSKEVMDSFTRCF